MNNYSFENERYKGQEIIFGKDVQKKLEKLNIFVVGAWAVGCELLKYFSLMGISTNLDALLSVTDHDIIEKSNLNRRFLFREKDIIENKSKAECAVNSIKKINSKINSQYNVELVSDDIENIFKEKFFKKQNAIVLAVDNF